MGLWGGKKVTDSDRQHAALAEIRGNRVLFEDMAARAAAAPAAWASAAIARFAQLETDARAATEQALLDALVAEAESLAQQRAFLCPEQHITTEAKSHLFTMSDWGLPAKTIDSLKEIAAPALSVKNVDEARGALHSLFEEYDSWSSYIDQYNANTSFWASTSLALIAVTATAALFMMFGWSWKILAIVLAAVAGATASVIAHLPGLTSYGEWRVNLRAYQARIGTGIVGSLVGIGLLGSGLITIALPSQWKSADVLLDACLSAPRGAPAASTAAPAGDAAIPCKGGGMLFVLAITMLLGFSERLLTTLEGHVVAATPPATNQTKT